MYSPLDEQPKAQRLGILQQFIYHNISQCSQSVSITKIGRIPEVNSQQKGGGIQDSTQHTNYRTFNNRKYSK